ncbi:MAG: thermonuclease family protein [Pyrinomonadaceae bacterium]|nr:thermonuclease family protein [Pyrinomonadaceae bacterium]
MALSSNKPSEFDDYPDELAQVAPHDAPARAVIKRVIDGDTIVALIDQRFSDYKMLTLRIAGIDAPEMFSGSDAQRERGRGARDYLLSLAPPGTHIVVRTYQDKVTFNRYVADVTLPGGLDLATEMIRAGHAVVIRR